MALAFQCDKCKGFSLGVPFVLRIYMDEVAVLEKELCEACKEEIERLVDRQEERERWRR